MKFKFTLLSIVASVSLSLTAQTTELTKTEITEAYNATFKNATPNYVTVHDPSVVIGYEDTSGKVTAIETTGSKKVYCIFGSHKAWAKSYDLQNWTYFTNNISNNFKTIFAEDAAWSALGSSSYDVSGNLWAPDVVWNPTMNKWCMYMSVNGDYWYSQIVLLTAESLTGDWTRIGTVVFSGFTASNASKTDLYDILGTTSFPSRYTLNRNGNRTYGMNAIDPCAFFDEDGNMWMVYGSWFGGLYMLKLDPTTGLRDKTYTYETTDGTAIGATSDAYQGLKLAGGNHMSGEAPYIEYFNGKYYLFVTYGGLTANGGYNMRVFTSEKVTGPYKDISGNDARYSSSNTSVGNVNGSVGLRLMSYYRWNHMSYGYTAQGHNSAVVDTDDRMFLVYHTRFDDGTEGHQVRVHQLFQTKNKNLTAAPFQYRGETLQNKAFSAIDIIGEYGALSHLPTNYSSLECVKEKTLKINEDGTISGDFNGSWTMDSDGPYITFKLGTSTYEGVIIEQQIENTNDKRICFTAAGSNDYSVWGYKRKVNGSTFDEKTSIYLDLQALSLPSSAYAGSTLNFATKGPNGSTIEWQSDNNAIIDNEGNVANVTNSTSTNVTYTINNGSYKYTETKTINVNPADDSILGYYTTINDFANAKPNKNITKETGLSISFNVSGLTNDWDEIAKSTDNKYTLFLSVLRYNGNDHYEASATTSTDANETGVAAWQLFLNGNYKATISYNPDGTITYYRDDVLMLTYGANVKPNYPTTGTVTPATIVPAVIDYYLNDKITFSRNVSNIIIGYSVGYKADTSPISNTKTETLNIRNYGNKVVISGKNNDDIVKIYDIYGRLAYSSFDNTIEIQQNGIYIVKVNNITKRILICKK